MSAASRSPAPTPTTAAHGNGNGHRPLPTIGGELVDPERIAAEVEG